MHQERSPRSGVSRVVLLTTAVVTAVVVGLVGYSVGRLSTIGNSRPSDTSAEAGFARDMQVHHLQGVDLAMIVRDLTDEPAVRLLAYDIATAQGQQSGQLYGWLTQWELSQLGSEPSMTWMTRPGLSAAPHTPGASIPGDSMTGDSMTGDSMPGHLMPGLATPAQIAELSAASGVEAERIFLTLMIAHHQGAIEMGEAALARTSNTSVRAFARAVVISQTSEIDLMTGMLADRS